MIELLLIKDGCMHAKLRIFVGLLIFGFFATQVYAEGCKERLILHFDVNETLIASDQATGKSAQDNVNRALATKYREKWSENLAEPITYKDYVYQYLLPSNKQDSKLKAKRLDKLFHFVDFIKASEYPIKKQVIAEYQYSMSKFDAQDPIQIFPSFFVMMDELKKANIPFTIQIRTFGHDLNAVIQAINKKVNCRFFNQQARFENKELFIESRAEPIASLGGIYEFFKMNNTGVQDNWKEWDAHQSLAAYGKLFPIDLEDPRTTSIFFDDNIRVGGFNPESNIVAPVDIRTGQLLPVAALIDTHNLVVVDMLQAIQDDRYFINQVNAARAPTFKQKRLELLRPIEQFH